MRYALILTTILGTATLSGCPELQPPFDASGEYVGEYSVGLGGLQVVEGCEIQLSLDHNANGLPIQNARVEGSVTLSFDCVVPEDIAALAAENAAVLGIIAAGFGADSPEEGLASLLALQTVDLEGVLLPDGTLELNTPEFLGDCSTGECIKLALLGKGQDANSDGSMDQYNGTLVGTLGASLLNLPIAGEFQLSLAE